MLFLSGLFHCIGHRDSDLLAEWDVNLLLGQGKMLNCKWKPNSNTCGCFSNDPVMWKGFLPFLCLQGDSPAWSHPLLSEWASSLITRMYKQLVYQLWSLFLSSVQSLSHVQLFATTWTAGHQASLSITNSQTLLKLMSIESVMPSNHLILCRYLLLLPSTFPSIKVFSNESVLCIRWAKYWSFSFGISPSNEYSGLISFRIDCLDLITVQGTLKHLLQHHSSKASTLQCSAFFILQLSHPYMTTGKTIAVTRRTFFCKVMSLLFNMLSRLVKALLPRSKHLSISWLQLPSAVILESKKIKSLTVSIVSQSICHEVMGLDAMILVFWMLSFKPTFPLSSFTFIKGLFSSF